jgi:hypothetical protein
MKPKRIFCFFVALGLIASMTACSGVRKQLGLEKTSPDEFKVVSRAPLTLPPDFNLRPPEPGAPRPQVGTPTDQAKRAVFGIDDNVAPTVSEVMPYDGRSFGERALLVAAGVEGADPNIRVVIDRETDRINDESQDFIDTLVFWRSTEPPGAVLDAEGESKRLQENATLGRGVDEGETPTIERKEKALFEF